MKLQSWLVTIILLLIAIAFGLSLWRVLDVQRDQQSLAEYQAHINKNAALILADLKSRTTAVRRMADRWEITGRSSKNEFLADAANYHADFPGFQVIQWADARSNVQWAYPSSGVVPPLGFDNNAISRNLSAMEHATLFRTQTMTSPLTLQDGSAGFMVFFPLHYDKTFDGFIIAVFRVGDWIDAILNKTSKENKDRLSNLQVLMEGQVVHEVNTIEQVNEQASMVEASVSLLGRKIVLRETTTSPEKLNSFYYLPEALSFLLGLILFLLLYTASIYISLVRSRATIVKAQREAEKANRAKTDFLSTMSHEIRTPLNGVLGMAELLVDSSLNPDQRTHLDVIRSSGEHLLNIINDVLDVVKIESGEFELETVPFDLNNALSTIIAGFKASADNDIDIRFEYRPDNGYQVWGDPTRTRQIFTNLISNAVKFTSEGEVVLTLETVEEKETATGPFWEFTFSVKDTGIGIPQEKLDTIFSNFTQADAATTRKYGGTGLGLGIVKSLTEKMYGDVGVTSNEGEGSTFHVKLLFEKVAPLVDVLQVAADEWQAPREALDILVAEDVIVNAIIVQNFLQKLGHNAHLVQNGQQAVDAIRDKSFDLILMDVHMPVLDGVDATKEIRKDKNLQQLPIIGLTAEAFVDRHIEFMDAGMDSILTKPYTLDQLDKAIIAQVT